MRRKLKNVTELATPPRRSFAIAHRHTGVCLSLVVEQLFADSHSHSKAKKSPSCDELFCWSE